MTDDQVEGIKKAIQAVEIGARRAEFIVANEKPKGPTRITAYRVQDTLVRVDIEGL